MSSPATRASRSWSSSSSPSPTSPPSTRRTTRWASAPSPRSRAAGKKPGKDVKIVSVDGTRNAVQALANGEYNAVIESNPRFGPLAFATAQKFYAGEEIPENVIITDREYDEANAKDSLGGAY